MPDKRKYRNCPWFGGAVTVSLVCRRCERPCRARNRPPKSATERYGNPRDLAERRHPYGCDQRDDSNYEAMLERGYDHMEIINEGPYLPKPLPGMSIL